MDNHTKLWTRDFVAVCLCSFFLFITFYILAVTLPIIVTETLRGNERQVGASLTDYRMMYLIAAIIVACTAFLYYGLHHRNTFRGDGKGTRKDGEKANEDVDSNALGG